MSTPEDLNYTAEHEWVRQPGDRAVVEECARVTGQRRFGEGIGAMLRVLGERGRGFFDAGDDLLEDLDGRHRPDDLVDGHARRVGGAAHRSALRLWSVVDGAQPRRLVVAHNSPSVSMSTMTGA